MSTVQHIFEHIASDLGSATSVRLDTIILTAFANVRFQDIQRSWF